MSIDSTPIQGTSYATFVVSFIRVENQKPRYFCFTLAFRECFGGRAYDYEKMIKDTLDIFDVQTSEAWAAQHDRSRATLLTGAADKGAGALDALSTMLGKPFVSPDPAHSWHNALGKCLKDVEDIETGVKELRGIFKSAKQTSKTTTLLKETGIAQRVPSVYSSRWGYFNRFAEWILRHEAQLDKIDDFVDQKHIDVAKALMIAFKPVLKVLKLVQLQAPCDSFSVLYATISAYGELWNKLKDCIEKISKADRGRDLELANELLPIIISQTRRRFFDGLCLPCTIESVRRLDEDPEDRTKKGCLLAHPCVLATWALSPFCKFKTLVRAELISAEKAEELEVKALNTAWKLLVQVEPKAYQVDQHTSMGTGTSLFALELDVEPSASSTDSYDLFKKAVSAFTTSPRVVEAFKAMDVSYKADDFSSLQCTKLMEALYAEAGNKDFVGLRPLLVVIMGTMLKSVSSETAHSTLEFVCSGRRSSTNDYTKAAYLFCKSIPFDIQKPMGQSKPQDTRPIHRSFSRMLAKGREEKAAEEAETASAAHNASGTHASNVVVVSEAEDDDELINVSLSASEALSAQNSELQTPPSITSGSTAEYSSVPLPITCGSTAAPSSLPLRRIAPPAPAGVRRSSRQTGWTTLALIDLLKNAPRKRDDARKRAHVDEEIASDPGNLSQNDNSDVDVSNDDDPQCDADDDALNEDEG